MALRSAADQDVRLVVRSSAAGRTVRVAKASASFESVLRMNVGAAGLEIVVDASEYPSVAAAPVFVTEIATLALAVAAPLSLTVTEIV